MCPLPPDLQFLCMRHFLPTELFHPLCSHIGAQTSEGSRAHRVGWFQTMEAHKWFLGFGKNAPPMCTYAHIQTHTHTHICMNTHTHSCSRTCLYSSTFLSPRRSLKHIRGLSDFSGIHMCASGDSIWLVGKKWLSFSVAIEKKIDPRASLTMGSSFVGNSPHLFI